MLLHRVLTALVAIPIILAAIWLGPPWITALVAVAAVVGVREAYKLYPSAITVEGNPAIKGIPTALGGVWATALVLAGELATTPSDFVQATVAIFVAGCIIAGLWMIAAWRGRRPVATAAWLCMSPVYIGAALACALALRGLDGTGSAPASGSWSIGGSVGFWWLLLAILGVYAADTAAYFVGRLLGRRRMAPSISPGKTWEGAAGGLAGATGITVLVGVMSPLGLEVWQSAVAGVILGTVSPMGDLLESKMKRLAGVKDSGTIFPGHGGMLDRLDSLLPSFIAVYVLAVYFTAAG